MATLTNEVKFSIKIIIDVKLKKVVFAETGKDFVDFMFSLMTLPLSSVTKLLSKKGMVGALGSLYKSIESLEYQYYETIGINKDSVLVPKASIVVPLLCLREGPNSAYGQTPRYVKDAVKYMVMDNLEVKPMSISLIRSLVQDFDFIEEKQVQFGLHEGLALLKASLENQAVLTYIFFGKKFEH